MPYKEKRLYRARSKCPAKIEGNLKRASQQTFSLIEKPMLPEDWRESIVLAEDECQEANDPAENVCPVTFRILGSTSNDYTVTLDCRPTCTCPNFQKEEDVCKHIFYVLLKIVGLPKSSTILYQRAYLTTELFKVYTCLETSLAGKQIRTTPLKVKNAIQKRPEIQGGVKCRLCRGDLSRTKNPLLCPNGCVFHKECLIMPQFDQLSLNGSMKNKVTTTRVVCPKCNVQWDHDEGYVNFAYATGQKAIRDKSTYRPTPGYPGYRYK